LFLFIEFGAGEGNRTLVFSWEGFVIETLIACASAWTNAFFYRTATGSEIDLLLELPNGKMWAIEIKRGRSPKVEAGFHIACEDLDPVCRFVVYGGSESITMPHGIEAVGVHEMATRLTALTVR
jgi:uncharacterized protein